MEQIRQVLNTVIIIIRPNMLEFDQTVLYIQWLKKYDIVNIER